jgi:hypothetical protein
MSGQETFAHALREIVARNVVDPLPSPHRLLRRLKRRVLEQCTVMPSGFRVAPRYVEVRISPEDDVTIEELGGMAAVELDLATVLVRHARLEGWQLNGRVVVRLVVDERVRHGQVPPARTALALPLQERTTEPITGLAGAATEPVRTAPLDPEPRLVLEVGTERLEVHDPPTVVGRRNDGRVTLEHPTVSWRHAELSRSPRGWTVRDLCSTNGTFVDDRRVPPGEPALLEDGAVLRLGALEIVVRVERRP